MKATRGETWWPRFSLARCIIWVVATILGIALGWIYSVAFVAACSLYANIASDFAAWRADRNPALDRIEERLDRIEALLEERL